MESPANLSVDTAVLPETVAHSCSALSCDFGLYESRDICVLEFSL